MKDKLTSYNGTTITYDLMGNPLSYRDGITMAWQNGRQLATLSNDNHSVSYSYDSNSVRISKTVDGVKYTYEYLNGKLLYETRGEAKFWYSYDSNGILYNIRYTLSDGSAMMSYYCTHNSRGDIIGIYNGDGILKAQYKYDSWGNVLSVTDENGNAITSATHIGNLNPFRYRGYYYDTESGFYYLMSRYYDPVTHRFINADGYFQSGGNILDANMHAYCGNNPIMFADPTGLCYVAQYTNAGTYIGTYWVIQTAVPGVPDFCNKCKKHAPGVQVKIVEQKEHFNGGGFKLENTTTYSSYYSNGEICNTPTVTLGFDDISASYKLGNVTVLAAIEEYNGFTSMVGFGDDIVYSVGHGFDADSSFICWDVTTNFGNGIYYSNTSKLSISNDTKNNIAIGATIVCLVVTGIALVPETGGASAYLACAGASQLAGYMV